MNLTKKITDLTLEDKIDLIEAAYILWLHQDFNSLNYEFASDIIRGNGFTQITPDRPYVVEGEFNEIYTFQYDQEDVTTVEEMIDAVFEESAFIKDLLQWMSNNTRITLSEEAANRIVDKIVKWTRKNINILLPSLPWNDLLFNSDVTLYSERHKKGAVITLKFYLEDGRKQQFKHFFSSVELQQIQPDLLEDVICNCLRAQMYKR
jgi:hypothetical protein